MPRYAHANLLDGGLNYLAANCDKVILTNAYTTSYATANGSAKVAECALVTGDFAIAGADGAARTLTATLAGKAAGNALMALDAAAAANMHLAFVKTSTSEVIYVIEESSNQAITLSNPVTLNSNPTYVGNQPTA